MSFSNFSWVSALIGAAFALWVWPFLLGLVSNARAKVSKAAG